MRKLVLVLSMLSAVTGEKAVAAQVHIPKGQLEEMFTNIQAQTPWDVRGRMLWGYYFTSPDRDDLEKIGAELASNGYKLVAIRRLEAEAPHAASGWQLRVERVERQTVDTLDAKNTQLEGLATGYTDVIYDGMDVGPAN